MKRVKIYIEKHDWVVTAYIAVTYYEVNQILRDLKRVGCSYSTLLKAEERLRKNEINSGLTYSSYKDKESVMVTALANSAKQQFNTITHEICHVCSHIAEEIGIDPASEEFAYLVGDLSMAIFPKVRKLLCDCCRKKNFVKPK